MEMVNLNLAYRWYIGYDLDEEVPDHSSLSKIRRRLGSKYFAELERESYQVLIERKIIKAKGMLIDATVFPEHVRYPTDTGLLNIARQWVVGQIKKLGSTVGRKILLTVERHSGNTCHSAKRRIRAGS